MRAAGDRPRRQDRGYAAPRLPLRLSAAGLAVAALTVGATGATCVRVIRAIARKGFESPLLWIAALLFVAASALLLVPAVRSLRTTVRLRRLAGEEATEVRAAAAEARSLAWMAIGYSLAVVLILLLALFIIANHLAVGETFFNIKLMNEKFWLVFQAFVIVNVQIFLIAQVLILAWSLVIVVARLAPGRAGAPLRLIATAYVDMFRALPAIIAIYLIGFGLPLTGLKIFDNVPQMWFAILALTLIYGAFVSEVYRSGIESVHPSQTAAARSLGLSYAQTMRWVVLPQALRRIVPPLLNDFIALQKDTALVNVIGTIDTFNQAKMVTSDRFNLSAVTIVALLFIIITIPQSRLVDWMMESDRRRTLAGR